MGKLILIEGGRLLDIARRRADPANILVEDDRIAAPRRPARRHPATPGESMPPTGC